jgi:hypothetical protein
MWNVLRDMASDILFVCSVVAVCPLHRPNEKLCGVVGAAKCEKVRWAGRVARRERQEMHMEFLWMNLL